MRRRWKEELRVIYEAPKPERKAEFLEMLEEPGISVWEFVLRQVRYIRKWNWIVGGIVFLVILFGSRGEGAGMIGGFSVMVPLLALCTVAEGNCSRRHGMDELELSSRFSLKAVVMARLGITGLGDLIVLGMIFPVMIWQRQEDVIGWMVSVLMPYLLACFLNLVVVQKIQREESFYWCCGVTILISGTYMMMAAVHFSIYDLLKPVSWFGVIGLLGVLTARECLKMFKQSEEYVWNL